MLIKFYQKGIIHLQRFKLYQVCVFAIIFAGIGLRSVQYLANRSLWVDEAKFGLKIVNFSFLELFRPFLNVTAPLELQIQPGPIGYFTLTKFFVRMFGQSELILRLLPFLSGLFAIYLFYRVSSMLFGRFTTFVSMCLFAFSKSLTYYSSELHPYSSDVAIALVFFYFVNQIYYQVLSRRQILYFSLSGALLIWISYASIFVWSSTGLILCVAYLAQRKYSELKTFLIIFSSWILSFLLHYYLYIRYIFTSFQKHNYFYFFRAGFMPEHSAFSWCLSTLKGVFLGDPLNLPYWPLAMLLFVLGMSGMLRKDKLKFFLLLAPITTTFLAAVFRFYPFIGRTTLFLTPFFYLIIAYGFETFRLRTQKIRFPFHVFIFIGFFTPTILFAAHAFIHPIQREEIRPVMKKLRRVKKDHEFIYVHHGSRFPFMYYQYLLPFDPQEYMTGLDARDSQVIYTHEINSMKGKGRVWFLFSHINREEFEYITSYLNKVGKLIYSIRSYPGSGAWLYEI